MHVYINRKFGVLVAVLVIAFLTEDLWLNNFTLVIFLIAEISCILIYAKSDEIAAKIREYRERLTDLIKLPF